MIKFRQHWRWGRAKFVTIRFFLVFKVFNQQLRTRSELRKQAADGRDPRREEEQEQREEGEEEV